MLQDQPYIHTKSDREFHFSEMKRYVEEKQEMDIFLEKLISPFLVGKRLKILDAGCGIGHLIYWLNKINPESTFLGVDQTPFYIEEGGQKLHKGVHNVSFEIGKIEDLPPKYSKVFDISVSRMVLSWIPYYESFIRALLEVTRKHIFISSLFYDGDIDFITKIREFQSESGKNDFTRYYNVYSLPQFKRFVFDLGVKNMDVQNFEIMVDIPKGPVDKMGTYTENLANGRRLQISGAVLMNWKWIRIDL